MELPWYFNLLYLNFSPSPTPFYPSLRIPHLRNDPLNGRCCRSIADQRFYIRSTMINLIRNGIECDYSKQNNKQTNVN